MKSQLAVVAICGALGLSGLSEAVEFKYSRCVFKPAKGITVAQLRTQLEAVAGVTDLKPTEEGWVCDVSQDAHAVLFEAMFYEKHAAHCVGFAPPPNPGKCEDFVKFVNDNYGWDDQGEMVCYSVVRRHSDGQCFIGRHPRKQRLARFDADMKALGAPCAIEEGCTRELANSCGDPG